MKNWIKNILLILAPGLLFLLAWSPTNLFFLNFFALVPVFILANNTIKIKNKFFQIYLSILIWNIANTWWVYFASEAAIVMLILNALFMSLPVLVYMHALKRFNATISLIFLIAAWISFEFLHLRWDLSWPWLTLGNSLAGRPEIIQWYSITGRLGGSLWLLCINYLFYLWFFSKNNNPKTTIAYLSSVLFIPILASLLMYFTYSEKNKESIEVVALQPSFDSWNEKFVRASIDMLQECTTIADKYVSNKTQLLVFPETSLVEHVETRTGNINGDIQIRYLKDYMKKHPNLEILTGADMQKTFDPSVKEKPTRAARRFSEGGIWYEVYNSSIFLGKQDSFQFQHKSKLVPGPEIMPFTNIFPFIEKLAVKLDDNSATGTLGITENPIAFGNKIKFGAPICYESNYGEYNSKFVKTGAQFLCVITNDGWWQNTPGHKQHKDYGRLLALEHRRWVVRSANTGISCIINARGDVLTQLDWNKKGAVKGNVVLNNSLTLFTRFGDYIGRIAVLVLLVLTGYSVYLKWFKIKLDK